jgi:c-di-GMP-binding flagellar brake protein YcgR
MRSIAVSANARTEGQRRSTGRYPVAADVAYQLGTEARRLGEGCGRSVNISSSGILIATETGLPVGVAIALQIAWPAKLNQFVALNLHIEGRTVRSSGNHAAVVIIRYEFRTRRQV